MSFQHAFYTKFKLVHFILDTTIPGFDVLCTVRDYFTLSYGQREIKANIKYSYAWVFIEV